MAENRKRKAAPSSQITSYFSKAQRKDGKSLFPLNNRAVVFRRRVHVLV